MSKKSILIIILILIIFFIGYKIGQNSIEIENKIEYQTQYPFKYTFEDIKVDKVSVPNTIFLKSYQDTIWETDSVFITQPVDSLAILMDWLSTRYYNEVLFDNDTLGKLNIEFDIHKNRLNKLTYEYTPIKQIITNTKIKRYELTAGFGLTTHNNLNLELGLFKNNYGIELTFGKDMNYNKVFYGLSFKYKLGI